MLQRGPISYAIGSWPPPWGIEYRVDLLNALRAVLVSGIAAVMMPFAAASMAAEVDADSAVPGSTRMYLLCLAGLLGITITGDAFNIFVFLEISSLSTYVLIALGRDRRALVAAYQYLIMGTIGATFIVIGIGLLYLMTGTPQHGRHGCSASAGRARRFAAGAGRARLPDRRHLAEAGTVSASPVAAERLHLCTVVGRRRSSPRPRPRSRSTCCCASTSRCSASPSAFNSCRCRRCMLAAVGRRDVRRLGRWRSSSSNLKRLFAYSASAQIGYIMLGIAFANAGGTDRRRSSTCSTTRVTKARPVPAARRDGLSHRRRDSSTSSPASAGRMPLTMAAFASRALADRHTRNGRLHHQVVPGGRRVREGQWWLVVFLIVASSLLAIVYVGRFVEVAWFREPSRHLAGRARGPPLSHARCRSLLLAAATIYFGFDTTFTVGIARRPRMPCSEGCDDVVRSLRARWCSLAMLRAVRRRRC